MTRAAEQLIIKKIRSGQPVGAEDHIGTIDDIGELEAFRAGIASAGRLTHDVMQAIERRKNAISRRL